MEDYSPGSYAYIGEFQQDGFYYFRSDGTGITFDRDMIIDENRKLIAIVSEYNRETGEYKAENIIRIFTEFTWQIESGK